jgi:hypothetical protein
VRLAERHLAGQADPLTFSPEVEVNTRLKRPHAFGVVVEVGDEQRGRRLPDGTRRVKAAFVSAGASAARNEAAPAPSSPASSAMQPATFHPLIVMARSTPFARAATAAGAVPCDVRAAAASREAGTSARAGIAAVSAAVKASPCPARRRRSSSRARASRVAMVPRGQQGIAVDSYLSRKACTSVAK